MIRQQNMENMGMTGMQMMYPYMQMMGGFNPQMMHMMQMERLLQEIYMTVQEIYKVLVEIKELEQED